MLRKLQNYLFTLRYFFTLNRIRTYKEVQGWLSKKEAVGLYKISSYLPKNAIAVEIGSWKGKSTICIGKGLKDGKIFAIDPFNAYGEEESQQEYLREKGEKELYATFETNILKAGLKNKIVPLKGYSFDYIGYFTEIDFLFIDGDHSKEGCMFDYNNFAPKIKIGGYLAFHDFQPDRSELGPTWVISQLIPTSGFIQIGIWDSLWVGRRIK